MLFINALKNFYPGP